MSRFAVVLAGALAAPSALAAPAPEPTPAPGRTELAALAHFGVATAPFEVSSLREAKGQAFVFGAAASYGIAEPLALELSVPWVLGSVAQPAGSYVDAAALGNPELGVRYRVTLRRGASSLLAAGLALGVGLPLASHAEDLMPNRVLAIANGIEGRGRPQWFTAGALPITPSGNLRWLSPPWSLEASLQVPLLVRVSRADVPASMADRKPLGFALVASTEARYRFSRRLSLALAEQLFLDAAPFAGYPGDVSPAQDFERVSLHIHLGSASALVVDLQTAIAGELGGRMVAGGLRAVMAL